MSAARPHDDTQPIPVVRGRHAAPKATRTPARWALIAAREAGIVAAVVAALIIAARLVLGQVAYVADDAMLPTLAPGERVLVSPWGDPAPGDVVAIAGPAEWGTGADDAIVRVIAVGGQRVTCCDEDGRISVDGTAVDESYARGPTDQVDFDVVVPPGEVFVLADDRATARDSRVLLDSRGGTLSVDDVRGRVVAVLWPPRPLGS
jgi:signal peptidase I